MLTLIFKTYYGDQAMLSQCYTWEDYKDFCSSFGLGHLISFEGSWDTCSTCHEHFLYLTKMIYHFENECGNLFVKLPVSSCLSLGGSFTNFLNQLFHSRPLFSSLDVIFASSSRLALNVFFTSSYGFCEILLTGDSLNF